MAITAGSNLNIVPAAMQQTLATNYIDFTATATAGWAQQYLPDLMEKEAEVFGPRTISGFLSQVGAEEAMQSDQVVWSEQGRLHLSYKAQLTNATTQPDVSGTPAGGSITIDFDIDGNQYADSITGGTTYPFSTNHGIRVNDLLLIASSAGTAQCICTAVVSGRVNVAVYSDNTLGASGALNYTTTGSSSSLRVLVYGSEYAKGKSYLTAAGTADTDQRGANKPAFKTFTNKPIIIKDYYEISGSDTSQIGWVETTGEDGQSGYLWYLKAGSDTKMRFTDYLEMALMESRKGGTDTVDTFLSSVNDPVGTQGLFDAIGDRGNKTSGITGVNAATDLAEFDAILAEFDKQGAIEENMMFLNRSTSLAIDDMLASMNGYGAGGTSYGVFDNSEDMALNLGFSGFRRGSYDFYKSDFKYLNDRATRGGINDKDVVTAIRGVMIPAGVSSVYDEQLGKNLKRPFLHVRYRASQADDRKLKTWTTGSVGAVTSALDAMQVHYLSERCLITQGANNFMLMV